MKTIILARKTMAPRNIMNNVVENVNTAAELESAMNFFTAACRSVVGYKQIQEYLSRFGIEVVVTVEQQKEKILFVEPEVIAEEVTAESISYDNFYGYDEEEGFGSLADMFNNGGDKALLHEIAREQGVTVESLQNTPVEPKEEVVLKTFDYDNDLDEDELAILRGEVPQYKESEVSRQCEQVFKRSVDCWGALLQFESALIVRCRKEYGGMMEMQLNPCFHMGQQYPLPKNTYLVSIVANEVVQDVKAHMAPEEFKNFCRVLVTINEQFIELSEKIRSTTKHYSKVSLTDFLELPAVAAIRPNK